MPHLCLDISLKRIGNRCYLGKCPFCNSAQWRGAFLSSLNLHWIVSLGIIFISFIWMVRTMFLFASHHIICKMHNSKNVHFVNPHTLCIRMDNSNLRQKVQWFLINIIRSRNLSNLRTLKLSSHSSSSVIQLQPLAMILSPILFPLFTPLRMLMLMRARNVNWKTEAGRISIS